MQKETFTELFLSATKPNCSLEKVPEIKILNKYKMCAL